MAFSAHNSSPGDIHNFYKVRGWEAGAAEILMGLFQEGSQPPDRGISLHAIHKAKVSGFTRP